MAKEQKTSTAGNPLNLKWRQQAKPLIEQNAAQQRVRSRLGDNALIAVISHRCLLGDQGDFGRENISYWW
jgi:hypothetical protein